MKLLIRGVIGALCMALLSSTGAALAASAAEKPQADKALTVTAETAVKKHGTDVSKLADYPAVCAFSPGGVTPWIDTIHGVPSWIIPDTIFGRGHGCQIGKAFLTMRSNGNLVLYDETGRQRWATNRYGHMAYFQGFDGNFVQYADATKRYPLWASDTCCRTLSFLAVQADGNVVVYENGNTLRPLWTTNTAH